MHFILRLDLANHAHRGAAQHALVCQMLNLARQAIGSDSNRKGELTIPTFDASRNTGTHATVGLWEFVEDETRNPDPEA